jgi:hypothetical protein
MTEHVTQPINNADSDSDVQEIHPPVLLRSTRERRRRRIIREMKKQKKEMKKTVLLQVLFIQYSQQFREKTSRLQTL